MQGAGSTNASATARGAEAASGGGASGRRGGGGHIGVVEGMAPPVLPRRAVDLTSGGAHDDELQDFTRSRRPWLLAPRPYREYAILDKGGGSVPDFADPVPDFAELQLPEPGSRTGACARSMASASVGWYRVQGGVAGPHARSSSAAGRRVWRFRHARRLRMRYLILSQRAWRNRHSLAFARVDVALLRVTTCEVVLSRRVWRFRTTCTDRVDCQQRG